MKFLNSYKERVFDIDKLSSIILKGSAVLIPTDTLPAIAARPSSAAKLWEIKSRPQTKPFILMGSSVDELFSYVSSDALDDAYLIASKYWPGALTIILPASGKIVDYLNPGQSSLGFRIPNCSNTLDLLSITGPLATSSANISGKESAIDEKDASRYFPDLPLLGPTPWPRPSGIASTLISWKGKKEWQTLRQGNLIPEIV